MRGASPRRGDKEEHEKRRRCEKEMKGNEKTDVKNLGGEKKKKMNAKVLFATAAAFIVLLSFGAIASADPYCGGLELTGVHEGEVSGDLWVDVSGPLAYNEWAKSYTLPAYTDVEWAQLYVGIYCGHMQKNYPGTVNVTFNGVHLGATPISELLDGCYTYPALWYETACTIGSSGYMGAGPDYGRGPEWINDHCVRVTSDYLMWYDVTDLVAPNSNVAIETSKIYPNFDGRIKLVTLVVAYNDGDTDTVHYWVNRGHDVDNYKYEGTYIGETSFSADLPEDSTVHNSNLSVVQMASTDGAYTFNGVSIPTDPTGDEGVNWQGGGSGYNTWYASSLFNSIGDNTLTYDRNDAYYKIGLAFLTVNYTEAPPEEPDLIVEAVVLNQDCEHYYFAKESNVVDVTVKNIGAGAAGASHVKLSGASGDSASVAVGALAADASEKVSITDTIARPAGEQVIAIADCDGEVDESDETNNESAAGTEINHGLTGKN